MTEVLHFQRVMALVDLWRCVDFLAGIVLLWIVTGMLKTQGKLRESDSRKINHIAVFVGGTLTFGWLPEMAARVNLYAIASAILILIYLVCRYRTVPPFCYAYAANTRASDAPHTTFFFSFSWCVSIAALTFVDLLFTQMPVTRTALLVVGVADGIAEPIGRRFGKHKYPVFSFGTKTSFRSIEGSLAVWLGTLVVLVICSTSGLSDSLWLVAALLMASTVALVEAISPRGCDNFSLLLLVAGLTDGFMRSHWIA